MLRNAKNDYTFYTQEVDRLEKLQQDYLHKLELEDLKYEGRAKVATQLARCRQQRREAKDMKTALEPLVFWLDTDKGKQLTNMLNEVLGQTRKVENKLKDRIYYHRVLQENPIRSK